MARRRATSLRSASPAETRNRSARPTTRASARRATAEPAYPEALNSDTTPKRCRRPRASREARARGDSMSAPPTSHARQWLRGTRGHVRLTPQPGDLAVAMARGFLGPTPETGRAPSSHLGAPGRNLARRRGLRRLRQYDACVFRWQAHVAAGKHLSPQRDGGQ
jgi:hypothetical protein